MAVTWKKIAYYGDNIVVPDAGNIGSVSDTDAIAISAAGVLTFSGQSGCGVKLTSNQAIDDGTVTTLALATEYWDTQNEFNTGTYKFTASVAGKYLVCGTAEITGLDDGDQLQTGFYKNDVALGAWGRVAVGADGPAGCGLSCIMDLSVNDTLAMWVYHNYGASRNAGTSDFYNVLFITKIA